MKRLRVAIVAAFAMGVLFVSGTTAHHVELPPEVQEGLPTLPDGTLPQPAGSAEDVHSANMILVANYNDGETYRQGTDLAFWHNLAVAGNYGFPGGFQLIDISNPAKPTRVGQLECYGPQSDVSIWKDLVFLSVDTPMAGPECGASTAGTNQTTAGLAYEGIRIVSVANPADPQQIAFVDTDCGSHTHTLVPDEANGRLLIYVLSYPLGGQSPAECTAQTHRKISVVEVPLVNPAAAQVVSTPDVSPAIGCHDVTVLLPAKLAGAACISETQVWDISDPAHPRVLSHIANPAINIHHSTTFSYDARTLAIGDELGGAAVSPGCPDDGDLHLPLGAIWFYDISDPAQPGAKGAFRIQEAVDTIYCTAHNFNTVPLASERDVLTSAWYNGGTTVVDFSDPANPVELGYYIPKAPLVANAWSSYWYRGFIYANNFDEKTETSNSAGRSRGFDVLAISDKDLKKDAIKLKRLNPQTMEPLR